MRAVAGRPASAAAFQWAPRLPVPLHLMTVKTLGVIGSGIMGGGITEVAACAGHEVTLRSRDLGTAERTLASIGRSLDKRVDKGKIEPSERSRGPRPHLGHLRPRRPRPL